MTNREPVNLATLPWMTSLQDTASTLQNAADASITAVTPTMVTTLPLPTGETNEPFTGRVAAPSKLTIGSPVVSQNKIPMSVTQSGQPVAAVLQPVESSGNQVVSKLLSSSIFQHSIAVVCVFIFSLIILIVVQPPFTYTSTKEKYKRGAFSPGIASLYALGAAALAGTAMGITQLVYKKR